MRSMKKKFLLLKLFKRFPTMMLARLLQTEPPSAAVSNSIVHNLQSKYVNHTIIQTKSASQSSCSSEILSLNSFKKITRDVYSTSSSRLIPKLELWPPSPKPLKIESIHSWSRKSPILT